VTNNLDPTVSGLGRIWKLWIRCTPTDGQNNPFVVHYTWRCITAC